MTKALGGVRRIEAIILSAVVAAGAWSMSGFMQSRDKVCESVLRLHVVANSDSDEDQALKLEVRDAVLRVGADMFDGSVTAADAAEKILPRTDELEAAALAVIRGAGRDYGVEVSVREEYFATRAYEEFTLPAGRYKAVRAVIGDGAGKNWWCVMFPPLCLPAAQEQCPDLDLVLGEDGARLVSESPQIEVRFKIAEICGEIENFLKKVFN